MSYKVCVTKYNYLAIFNKESHIEYLKIENATKLIFGKVEGWIETFITSLPNLLMAALVVIGFILLAKLAKNIAGKIFPKISQNTAVNSLLQNLAYIFVLLIGIFTALGILNLDKAVTSLLAGAGVLGLALGFAFQEIAANFIAGIFIAFRKPYSVGDLVEIEGYFGIVDSINMRVTNIITPQGIMAIIPNKTMFTEPLYNYTNTPERRMDLSVGVSYGDDLREVKKITFECLKETAGRDKQREIEIFFKEFGDSSINFEVRIWHEFHAQKDFLMVRDDAILRLKEAFDKNDITIPFPIRTLDFGIKGGEALSTMISNKMTLSSTKE